MTSVPAISVRDVVHRYRKGLFSAHVVLDGAELEVAAGERLGLLGPNGAGKSTLLRLVAGIEPPQRGVVRTFGEAPRSAAARRRVGFVPEGAPFPRRLSARACLDLCASVSGGGSDGARRRAMLERVGLAGERRPLSTFSQGMLRRFAIAQAFLDEPELILLDEPSVGLDAEGHDVLDALLGEARERGATIVLSSHLLDEVAAWCDDTVLLVGGRAHRSSLTERFADGLRLEVEGLDASAADDLDAWIAERGGRVVHRSPSARALLAAYRDDPNASERR